MTLQARGYRFMGRATASTLEGLREHCLCAVATATDWSVVMRYFESSLGHAHLHYFNMLMLYFITL